MDKKGKKAPFPKKLSPMLATPTKEPFSNPQWVYEVKWDGYRVIAYIEKGKVVLHSREGQDYTHRYPDVARALGKLKCDAVLDGEVVFLNEDGLPDFNKLISGQPGHLVYYAFDLLWTNGYSLTDLNLLERKKKLRAIFRDNDHLKYSDHFKDGKGLFAYMEQLNMEGIIAKQKDCSYLPGKRVSTWLKIKINKRQEFVIGGWTESDRTNLFKSILFGEYVNGKLHFVHHSGGGYSNKEKKELFELFKTLEVKKKPFVNEVTAEGRAHWVKPVLVGEFEISNTTTVNGIIRGPVIYKGLREEKKPKDIVR